MGGLARRFGSGDCDEEGAIGSGPDCFADLMTHWLNVAGRPGCRAIRGSGRTIPSPAPTRLPRRRRRLRAGLGGGLALPAPPARGADVRTAQARRPQRPAGRGAGGRPRPRPLRDRARLRAWRRSATRSRARQIPDEARAAGKLSQTEGRERHSFPSASSRRRRRAPRGLGLAAARRLPRRGPGSRGQPGQRGSLAPAERPRRALRLDRDPRGGGARPERRAADLRRALAPRRRTPAAPDPGADRDDLGPGLSVSPICVGSRGLSGSRYGEVRREQTRTQIAAGRRGLASGSRSSPHSPPLRVSRSTIPRRCGSWDPKVCPAIRGVSGGRHSSKPGRRAVGDYLGTHLG